MAVFDEPGDERVEELAEALDDELRKIVGVGSADYDRALAVRGPLPNAMFNQIVRLVDHSGAPEWIDEWDRGTRKNRAGRKPLVPFRAVLVIETITVMMGMGIHYEDTARTLAYRLTKEQHLELGIAWDPSASVGRWYHRLWRAKKRMLQLLDPWHATGKRSILNAAQYARAKEQGSAARLGDSG